MIGLKKESGLIKRTLFMEYENSKKLEIIQVSVSVTECKT